MTKAELKKNGITKTKIDNGYMCSPTHCYDVDGKVIKATFSDWLYNHYDVEINDKDSEMVWTTLREFEEDLVRILSGKKIINGHRWNF